jgi:hypothetical protein
MNARARHASSPRRLSPTPRTRLLLRAGLTVTAAGAVVGGTAAAASASASTSAPSAPSAADATDGGGLPEGSQKQLGTPMGSFNTGVLHRPAGEVSRGVGAAAPSALAPAQNLRLNPFARSNVDPASNTVGTGVADSPSVSTAAVTAPIARGGSVNQVVDHITGPLKR